MSVLVLDFLSPGLADADAVWRSPLERALRDAPPEVEDLSRTGKLELRGDVGAVELPSAAELVQITPERALVLCAYEQAVPLLEELRPRLLVVDLTAAFAGLRIRGEEVVRRLTDLDLERLPAVGSAAGVRAVLLRDGEEFRLFFAQEHADYLAAAVLDALEGLR